MKTLHSLSHTKWDCKYHIVWIPKYRRKTLFLELRQELGPVLRELASHKESAILEGRLLRDHVHILISIPPKYAVSQVVGYIKGKSAIHIARNYLGKREYIRQQEGEDRRVDQLSLWN
jgi:putative transposase